MHVGRQALLVGNRDEQLAQDTALLGVKRGGEPQLVLPRKPGHLAQQSFSGGREVQGVQAAVAGVAAPFQEAAVLQLVHVDHHAAGQHSELGAERLLAAAGLGGDGPQDARMGRREPEGRHLLGEERGGVMAQLRQQECHAVWAVTGPV
ncbi:hypothetical protein AWC20_04340 [Mycobacterium parmense]|nr:hypothetical protein AWC20_04340 [Mycobacterium parmense]